MNNLAVCCIDVSHTRKVRGKLRIPEDNAMALQLHIGNNNNISCTHDVHKYGRTPLYISAWPVVCNRKRANDQVHELVLVLGLEFTSDTKYQLNCRAFLRKLPM